MSVQNLAHYRCTTLLTGIITTFNSQKAIASYQSHSLDDVHRKTKSSRVSLLAVLPWIIFRTLFLLTKYVIRTLRREAAQIHTCKDKRDCSDSLFLHHYESTDEVWIEVFHFLQTARSLSSSTNCCSSFPH